MFVFRVTTDKTYSGLICINLVKRENRFLNIARISNRSRGCGATDKQCDRKSET